MSFHYGKHHQTYVNNLNGLMEQAATALEKGDHVKVTELSQAIKFNGGGHVNHEFFWESLAPMSEGGGVAPAADSELGKLMTKCFGSQEDFVKNFSASTIGVQGSGWGWLAYNK